jgi:hypothetical protein
LAPQSNVTPQPQPPLPPSRSTRNRVSDRLASICDHNSQAGDFITKSNSRTSGAYVLKHHGHIHTSDDYYEIEILPGLQVSLTLLTYTLDNIPHIIFFIRIIISLSHIYAAEQLIVGES